MVAGGHQYYLVVNAMKQGQLVVVADYDKVTPLGQWSKLSLGDDLKIETRQLTVSVVTPTWIVNVTSKV